MGNNNKKTKVPDQKLDLNMLSKAIVGGGCFWCTEAIFQRLIGVQKVESGYAGGHIKNPTYSQICTGKTGHA
jgi:peptide methionine sulfoxide reductase MsrA